ncbi:hypothetical protein GQ55_9G547300 [Panicum hallii var. hallii]|uniref:Uncharacterized protein n=1 Tax=Panicum hallii var. hallii TaxID=1504633 RepID=A0A2T7CFB1_9POAL|nr:hypothetical protein GQ55_9G547300 [Panicum hallii var. hallii]
MSSPAIPVACLLQAVGHFLLWPFSWMDGWMDGWMGGGGDGTKTAKGVEWKGKLN